MSVEYDKINIDNYGIIIKNIVSQAIKLQFIKLNKEELEDLIEYITKITLIIVEKFNITNPDKQLKMNNYKDVYSIIVLSLPYYLIDNSKEITSFNEILVNMNEKAKILESTYYIDHKKNDFASYCNEMLKIIENGIEKMKHKLMSNYMNIYNYRMDNYERSYVYKDFLERYKSKSFEKDKLELGYYTLYGVINNFLFSDIIKIKWFIFDKRKIINNKIYYLPNIIILANEYKINDILHKNKDEIREDHINNISLYMRKVVNNDILDEIINSFIYFLKYMKILNRIISIKNVRDNITDKTKIDKLKAYINEEVNDESDEINENDEVKMKTTIKLEKEIKEIIRIIIMNIDREIVEEYYKYIYSSLLRYKYTWYGYRSISNRNIIYTYDEYINKNDDITIQLEEEYKPKVDEYKRYKDKFMIYSLKIYYNYFKSLLHKQEGEEYKKYNITFSYNSMEDEIKEIFIDRLNSDTNSIKKFYNIYGNIQRNYMTEDIEEDIQILISIEIYKEIRKRIIDEYVIVKIIFETLVYNGIFTYFRYNPRSTDKSILPDKNKQESEYKRIITANITRDMEENRRAYNFMNNIEYEELKILYKEKQTINKTYKDYIIGKNCWYMGLYCVDWTRQIKQILNHTNCRVVYITGGTGSGKSVGSPILALYNQKMMYYNNNAKVITTVPRIGPTKKNAYRMGDQLGVPIQKTRINYVQYKTANDYAYDNEYHLKLMETTDGSFYNEIKENFKLREDNNNICDVLLIDEHHEHNSYMDMIMTIFRLSAYYNNRITIGMISATMDSEEPQYRKYYRGIDDNWKYPLTDDESKNIDNNILDRRVHLSEPFGNLNYRVDEITRENKNELMVLFEILRSSTSGDVLIFEPGQKEIEKLVIEINKKTASNILAIPFYSKLEEKILNYIADIHNPEIRKKFRYPKNKEYTIENIDDEIPDVIPEGTYNRFVIVATNIAEASITIDTLSYVIETGTTKINKYDVESNQSILETVNISKSNQKQRKGRVGRVKPGSVYYLYDRSKLKDKSIPNICIENISDKIVLLMKKDIKKIEYNPYNNYKLEEIEEIKSRNKDESEFIEEIYEGYKMRRMKDKKLVDVYCDKIVEYEEEKKNIKFCDVNGRFEIEDLYDYEGKLYLNHPDEIVMERDENLEIRNIRKEENKYNIVDVSKNIIRGEYRNKIKMTVEYLRKIKILDDKYNKNEIYEKITENVFGCVGELGLEITLENTMVIVDVLKYYYGVEKNKELIKMLIIYLTFVDSRITIKLDKKTELKYCEYLEKYFRIEKKYFRVKIEDKIKHISKILNKIDEESRERKEMTNLLNEIRYEDYIRDNIMLNINMDNRIEREEYEMLEGTIIRFYKIYILMIIIIGENNNMKKIKYLDKMDMNKLREKDKKMEDIKYYDIYDKMTYIILRNNPNRLMMNIDEEMYGRYYKRNIYGMVELKDVRTNIRRPNRKILYYMMILDDEIRNIMIIRQKIIKKVEEEIGGVIVEGIDRERVDKIDKDMLRMIYKKIEKIKEYMNKR